MKLPLYARYGITGVWLVGLEAEVFEVCHGPTAQGYQEISRLQRGQRLSSVAFPGLELAVDEVLG